jgi:hypothetical protein
MANEFIVEDDENVSTWSVLPRQYQEEDTDYSIAMPNGLEIAIPQKGAKLSSRGGKLLSSATDTVII